jgi:hypothetical protein
MLEVHFPSSPSEQAGFSLQAFCVGSTWPAASGDFGFGLTAR